LFSTGLLFAGPVFSNQAELVVECIGDSITAGNSTDPESKPYPEEMAALLGGTYRVINSGVPSAHTVALLERFRSTAAKNTPSKIVVLAGVNDINIWDEQSGSTYGPRAVIARLRDLGVEAYQRGATTLYLTIWPDDDFSKKKRAAIAQVNEWILTRASKEVQRATAIDLMKTMTGQPGSKAAGPLEAYHDGSHLHLNAMGHRKVAEIVAKVLLVP
jgi:lysophospholipase L1-like esterase